MATLPELAERLADELARDSDAEGVQAALGEAGMAGLLSFVAKVAAEDELPTRLLLLQTLDRVFAAAGAVAALQEDEAAMALLVGGLSGEGGDAVQLLSLELLTNLLAARADDCVALLTETAVLDALAAALRGELGVAAAASKALLAAAGAEAARARVVATLTAFCKAASAAPTLQLRAFDITAVIAGSSAAAFQLCEEGGLLAPLLGLLDSDDILLQMNALELLAPLAASPHGADQLFRSGCVDALLARAGDGGEADALLALPALRAAASLLSTAASSVATAAADGADWVDAWRAAVVRTLPLACAALNAEDGEAKVAALFTLRQLSACADAPPAIARDGDLLAAWLPALSSVDDALRCAALHALAAVIRGSDDATATALVSALLGDVATEATAYAIDLASRPFADVRHAGLDLLRAMAAQHSCAGALLRTGAFADWLLDKRTESSHEAKIWKFSVCEAMAATLAASADLGSHELRRQLRVVLEDGPFRDGGLVGAGKRVARVATM